MTDSPLLRSLPFSEAKLAHEKQDTAEYISTMGKITEQNEISSGVSDQRTIKNFSKEGILCGSSARRFNAEYKITLCSKYVTGTGFF